MDESETACEESHAAVERTISRIRVSEEPVHETRTGGETVGLVTDAPHHGLCYRIIGAAMDVHNQLGPGLKEAHYQRALIERLRQLGIRAADEQAVEVYFDDRPVGRLYIDCLVEYEVIVELKAFPHLLTDEEIAQVVTYLAASGKPVGLLFNFGRKRLQFKRVFPPKKLEGWRERIERYLWRPPETRNWREDDVS